MTLDLYSSLSSHLLPLAILVCLCCNEMLAVGSLDISDKTTEKALQGISPRALSCPGD